MDPVPVALPFYRMTEIDWSSFHGFEDFVPSDFDTSNVQGFPAEKTVPVKWQKVDDGSMVSVMAPAVSSWCSA